MIVCSYKFSIKTLCMYVSTLISYILYKLKSIRLCLVAEKFLGKMSHRMFRAALEGFSDTNKKINYIACLEIAGQIY
jgi:hypothetical protein